MADRNDTPPGNGDDETKPATPPTADDAPAETEDDENKPEKPRYRWRANHPGTPDNVPFDQAPPDYIKKEFARRLHVAMIRKGLTQIELARQAQRIAPPGVRIGRDTISKWINEGGLPTPIKFAPVCRVLECEPEDLVPARGLTSARSAAAPTFSAQDMGHGLTWLRVNKAVPHETALKVMELLNSEQ